MSRGKRIFTDDEVRSIRASTLTSRELGHYFKCSSETIARVKRRDTYFYVQDIPQKVEG